MEVHTARGGAVALLDDAIALLDDAVALLDDADALLDGAGLLLDGTLVTPRRRIRPMNDDHSTPPPDTLNEVGVLKRREIEARIVAPLLERLGQEFGAERVTEIARDVVVSVAKEQGGQLAGAMGGNDLGFFADSLDNWTKGGALELDVVEQSDEVFAFNVTRCRYAEMYRGLGIPELGALFSCNRDGTMVEGFNQDITFERTQTIMGGASHCDFRYQLPGGTSVALNPSDDS